MRPSARHALRLLLAVGFTFVCQSVGAVENRLVEPGHIERLMDWAPVKAYTPENEVNPLPSAAATAFVQDPRGFIWLGIYSSGLVQYDGHTMELYTNEDGLRALTIRGLAIGPQGRLWVSSHSGLSVSKEPLSHYELDHRVEFTNTLGSTELSAKNMVVAPVTVGESVWAAARGYLMEYRLEPTGSWTTRTIALPTEKDMVIVLEVDHGRVLTGTQASLYELKGASDELVELEVPEGCAGTIAVDIVDAMRTVGICRDGPVWQRHERETPSLQVLEHGTKSRWADIARTHDGLTWLLREDGMALYRNLGSPPVITLGSALGIIDPSRLFEDRESRIWVSSNHGFRKISYGQRAFGAVIKPHLRVPAPVRGAELDNEPFDVLSVDVAPNGTVALGGFKGLVLSQGDEVHWLTKETGLDENGVWSVWWDELGRLWGGGSRSTFVFVPTGSPMPMGMEVSFVRQMLGKSWRVAIVGKGANYPVSLTQEKVGATGTCLYHARQGSMSCYGEFSSIELSVDRGLAPALFDMALGPDGHMWLGTADTGLYRMEPSIAELIGSGNAQPEVRSTSVWREKSQNGTNFSVDTLLFHRDKLWLATNGGLRRLRIDGAELRPELSIRKDNGLLSNATAGLAVSPGGNILYAGGNDGMSAVDVKSGEVFDTITRDDGLVDNEIWTFPLVASTAGAVYYGTPKGLAIYKPLLDQPNPVKPTPVFREVQFVQDNTGYNELSIRYAALSYASETKVRYKTRVVGYDDWSAPTAKNETRVMNLPAFLFPKTYVFEVIAANNSGVWSEEPIGYSFTVNPPFWLRWYTVGVIMFVLWFIVRTRFEKQRIEREALLERAQAAEDLREALDRAEEVNRLKNEFLANVSHELRTPLNAILNFPKAMRSQYEKMPLWHCDTCGVAFEDQSERAGDGVSKDMPCPECGHVPLEHAESWVSIGDAGEHVYFLERIEHSGNQLLGVINDLLDISHLESGRTQLCLEEVHLRDVLAQVRETIEPWARRKEHAVTWPELEGDIVIRADGSKLVQMLGHLLSNAVKFTGRGGRITLSVAPCDLGDRKAVGMTVRDTGEGIASNALKTIFDAFRMADGSHTRSHPGTGLGLAITHHLVHLHHGNIVVRSKLDEGSSFTLILPVQGPEPEEEVDGPA